jgi:hypothetical protein
MKTGNVNVEGEGHTGESAAETAAPGIAAAGTRIGRRKIA